VEAGADLAQIGPAPAQHGHSLALQAAQGAHSGLSGLSSRLGLQDARGVLLGADSGLQVAPVASRQSVADIDDLRRAPVVGAQADHDGVAVVAELHQLLAVGTTPAIDPLSGICDIEGVGGLQALDDQVLRGAGVLGLVHQQVLVPTQPARVDLGVFLQQTQGAGLEVAEREGVGLVQPAPHQGGDRLGLLQRLHAPALPLGVAEVPRSSAQQGDVVVVVVDGEVGVAPQGIGLLTQQLAAEAVQGADRGQLVAGQQGRQALAHLVGGLVGEGDAEDALGGHALDQERCGVADQGVGLPGAGPGDHQDAPASGLDGLALGVVRLGQHGLQGACDAHTSRA